MTGRERGFFVRMLIAAPLLFAWPAPASGPPRGADAPAARTWPPTLPIAATMLIAAGVVGAALARRRTGRTTGARPGPDDPVARGIQALREGHYEQAVTLFQTVVLTDGVRKASARVYLTEAMIRQGFTESVADEIARLPADTAGLDALYGLATACEDAGLEEAATGLFGQIHTRDRAFRDVARRLSRNGEGMVTRATPDRDPGGPRLDAPRPTMPRIDPSIQVESLPRRYVRLQVLTRGQMGVVLTGVDSDLDRRVAIKVLAPEYRTDASLVARFLKEAQAIATISHPNVVQVYDAQCEPVPFFTMERVDGTGLRDYLEQRQRVDPGEALSIGAQLARALGCLHSRGIVHRNVCPDSVIVLPGRQVKLVDFGLARKENWSSMPRSRSTVQSPRYRAPEVVSGGSSDWRADIFSLGVVLHELVTGDYPFDGEGPCPQVSGAQPAQPVLPLASHGLPEVVAKLIVGCLARDPDARVADAATVARVLSAHAGG